MVHIMFDNESLRPLGAHLSISLTNYKLLSSRVMASTHINQYDQVINDEALLLEIGRHFELLSDYKKLKPLPRALIPELHIFFGVNIYKDGSISAQSTVAYLLSIPHKTHHFNNKCEKLPQKVADPDK